MNQHAALAPSAARRQNLITLARQEKLAAAVTAAVEAAGGKADAARPAVLALLQQRLAAGREEARRLLDEKRSGLACARHLSALMDDIVAAIHHFATVHLYPCANPSSGERMAVAAVGGYGRGTLAPGSDVDLLLLFPHKVTPWCESVIETMLYLLWDLKLKTGHSTRSVADCIREGQADLTVRTALLETRFLFGDTPLFDEFQRRFGREVVAGTAADFVRAKLAERDQRLARGGDSRYRVEPNVKDGKGGLRDLNTLFWIAKYVYRVSEPRELVPAGLFSGEELALFERCEEFLWRVRCHMHFATGRAEERLSFDLQPVIAAKFGYAAHGGLSSVERFMKRYFLVAKDVGDLTAIVCSALEARHDKPPAMLSRLIRPWRRRRKTGALEWRSFTIEADRLTVKHPDAFTVEPRNIIRLFWLADRHDLAIHPAASRLVTKALKSIDHRLRKDEEANRLFLDILTSRNAPDVVLRRMNEIGVLGRFIPEFGRIVAMMQFNMYHHYTVDEHLIRTLGVIAEIDAGHGTAAHPLSSEIMPTIAHRRALYVAAFLHDVAKGRREDHSRAGGNLARRLGPRLGLDPAETETVAWLVEKHLIMSTVAQSRDLSDPQTIQSFAEQVQTLERLKLLLALTVADIRAVGPGVWNGWKGELLRTLYYETEVVLAGGHSALERKERVARAQKALAAELADWEPARFEAYAARHYPAYWLKVDLPRKVAQARFISEAEVEGRKLATRIATDAFRGVTELTVLATDHPKLLSIIAGACAAAGANIVDAQIFTTTDGMAVDTIFVSRAFDHDEDELRRARRVADSIEKALEGQIHLGRVLEAKRTPSKVPSAFVVPPEVVIDNSLSARHTVIEVSGLDRPGLLYELTTAISRLNLNIASAHIVTFGEKAVDVFYVTDLTGAKIANANRQAAIKRSLLEALAGDHAKVELRA